MSIVPTQHRSETVDLLKVLLTIGIVFLHASLIEQSGQNAAYDVFQHGIDLLGGLCVPLFFALSGYLYFRNVPEKPDFRFFWKKTRNRFSSLLLPYLIANAFAFLCYWAAWHFAPGMMAGYFGDSWRNPLFVFWTGPVNLSLWFIRDLFIAILLAPLYWLLIRFTRCWGVLALAAVWLLRGTPVWCNFYFILGAWAAIDKVDVAGCCRRTLPVWLLLYLACFIAAMHKDGFTKLSVLTGMPLCIGAAERLVGKLPRKIPRTWQAWCFFIYLYHYIPILTLKKVLPPLLGPGGFWGLLGTYLLTALLTLGLLSGAYLGMRRLIPRMTGILTGGR